MELKFALLADHVHETKEGKLAIIGEFDTIGALKAPARHALCYLVARLEASVSEGSHHKLQVTLVDEDGKQVLPLTPPMDVSFVPTGRGRPLRGQLIVQFADIELPRFGDYEFHLLADSRLAGAVHVRLAEIPQQT